MRVFNTALCFSMTPDALIALWLPHSLETALLFTRRDFFLSVRESEGERGRARESERERENKLGRSREYLENSQLHPGETPQEPWRKYQSLPLLLFSTSYLSSRNTSPSRPLLTHPPFSPPHPSSHLFCSVSSFLFFFLLCPLFFFFFFFFPGGNQEEVWEQQLPIGAGEWRSVVRDNLNVFLKACGKLGFKEAQLFHPGDLQDLSTRVTVKRQETDRRLKNVLITIYWLGRRAHCEPLYDGPHLNLKAFEGLLGTALSKALEESLSQKGRSVRDSGFGDSWYSEREEFFQLRGEGGGGGHRREDSLDSLDSLGSRPHSISSDATLKGSSEGCCSDAEAESAFRMAENKDSLIYRRSLVVVPKTTTQFNQFLPTKDKSSGYVPAPLRKKRAERHEDNRRSWASPMYTEEDGTFTRTAQKHDGSDGSKSMNDIQVDPTVVRQVRYEELQKYRDKVKESEDKWQDDLTKWKNRRRSVNLDIVKKKEEREQIEQITYGGGGGGGGGGGQRRSKTFKEMQEQRESRGSVGSRLGSLSYLDEDEDVFDHPVSSPRSRTLPARSYTIDTPYSQTDHWVSSLREEDSPAPPPQEVDRPVRRDTAITNPDTGTTTTTAATARHSTIHNPDLLSKAPPMEKITSPAKMESSAATSVSTTSYLPKATEPCRPTVGTHADEKPPSSGSLYKRQPQYNSTESKPPTASRVSASLPRSYQRSDCARLTSVIAPRPFGTQSTRVASLPRAVTMDDPHKRVNGDVDVSKKSSVPSRYHQFMTSEDEARSHSSSAHSSEDEEEDEEMEGKNISAPPLPVQSVSPVAPQVKSDEPVSPVPTKDAKQESYCDMRISLNQKPNSSRDFGFQADWDSTGAHVTSVQSGSPAEMCQLQVGDEVLTVSGHKVAHMSYPEWKACMEDALQQGSLVIDIRRHGKNNWDRNLTSLPFKSHKTINLTSTDHPIPLGASDANTVNPSLDFTSRTSTETLATREAPTHPIIDVASNGLNGGFREQPVTMRNKESEPIALKNLKRRSEFFEQGGSDSALSDVPVPSITPSSSRWSWDPEEERRRQEKWQKEQERLLQEKYKRDQEKLEEEWRKAQQEIASIAHQQQEPMSLRASIHSISPHSPLSPLSQPTSPWEDQAEEEERRRREEQERQRQAEEKRKREEEEKELQRLQKERKRREEEELRRQRRREEEKREEEERRHQEEAEWQRREQERVQEPTPWAKSKSTPQLDEAEKPEGKVTGSVAGEVSWRDSQKKSQQSVSQAEVERQQILQEMKKKTHLLTDSSWIRQSAAATITNKEPIILPMRRGESLDNLTGLRNSWRSSWTPGSTSSIPNYSRPHSALSGSTSSYGGGVTFGARSGSATLPSSYSMGSVRGGAGTPSSPWSQQSPSLSPTYPSPTTSPEPASETRLPQQRSRSVSGKKICTFCDNPLGKGAAMIIESLGLCYHLACFKCIDCKSDLGGSETGAEVRIRNKQLYCNSCYMRFKMGQPTAM
ncbi:LIM domain only protein 7 isoform X3 [Lampris incognitus]|uniref:LIM domain only protein 7 isoform X3 n=1 Tax=Lampris incognitus TaxID=2546036 RepID=UPI0024B5EEC7|nr:LIM domain only protein 7 isoform X3 [Lampris incognitus]